MDSNKKFKFDSGMRIKTVKTELAKQNDILNKEMQQI